MTKFYFVRHCESEMNVRPDLVGGRSNHAPATERGVHQARLLGEYLQNTGLVPDLIFSSGAVRTNTTARVALETAGISQQIIEDTRLQELSQGNYEGADRSLAYTLANRRAYRIDDIDGKFPGGESIRDVQLRTRHFIDDMHQRHPDATILLFGHGLAIRALVGELLGLDKQTLLKLETDNVSMTLIETTAGEHTVHFVGKAVIST